jgi:epoxyqueuosine reductase
VSLTEQAKDEALRLGFALAGVTVPESPPHWSSFENWLGMGRYGRMAYLAQERARELRRDPRAILPGCKSILVLAAPYPDPATAGDSAGIPPAEAGKPRGRVAAYAWGTDYHLILPQRMQALVAFIETQVGGPVPNRGYTDTGPILERDLAQQAGLGWIGKNTCLIHPRLGSYFFLAEILLGIALEPDTPFSADRCGTCTRCLDACPTQCILPDRTIDARRCISYLTIELKESIPPELRGRMGDWVFGCDICQEACPWNRFALASVDQDFGPRPGVPRPELIPEMRLTPRTFNRKFKDSPVQRAHRRGYLRNIAVALGNSGDPAAGACLDAAARDAEPLVREHAAWAGGRIRRGGRTRKPQPG